MTSDIAWTDGHGLVLHRAVDAMICPQQWGGWHRERAHSAIVVFTPASGGTAIPERHESVSCQRGATMSDTITIVGNLATEPKQAAPGGIPITSFRLAASQRHFDRATATWVEGATNWYSISVFRTLGEHALESLRKGDRIFVRGRLRIRDWTAGEKSGTTAEIDADALGHDLLWGTTVFTRAARGVSEAQDDAAAESPAPKWQAPLDDSESSAVTHAADDDDAMALAGAKGAVAPF